MKTYSPDEECPKCGMPIRFGTVGWNVQGEPKGLLYCRCSCGYSWRMLPLDAKGEGEDDA